MRTCETLCGEEEKIEFLARCCMASGLSTFHFLSHLDTQHHMGTITHKTNVGNKTEALVAITLSQVAHAIIAAASNPYICEGKCLRLLYDSTIFVLSVVPEFERSEQSFEVRRVAYLPVQGSFFY